MIEPDTKDWTWVLRRPCPDCGLDVSAVPRGGLARLLRENATAWPALLGPGCEVRPDPAVWSALEYGCHVRDVYGVFAERLRLLRTEDDPLFADWDQDETAEQGRYAEQDPARVALELVDGGTALADAFDAVRPEEWARPGRRSNGSVFTVETLGRYLLHDPVHHLWDVRRFRTG